MKTLNSAAAMMVLGLSLTPPSIAQQQPAGNVTEERVVADSKNGNDWLLNGRDFGEQHYSPVRQISDQNIKKLGLAWSLDIDSAMGMAAEPIEVDGVIYVSAPLSVVYAVDASTGRILWKADPKVRFDYGTQNSYAARVNRGVAVWRGKVYVSTGDCRLVALDAGTGRQLWSSQICNPVWTGSTGAPHVANGKVLIGYNGSDDMVRGSLVAFDAETGKESWRFWTVPGDPSKGFESKLLEAAAKTWNGDRWWRFGGGAVWDAITYDPSTGLVIFGTAGAGTTEGTILLSERPTGAMLYAGSVIAVKADTGEYVWHFQTSGKDFQTENFHTIVTDLVLKGKKRHVAITAPRNGFIYVLDATTGKLIEAKPYGTTYWATAIDVTTGRPADESPGGDSGPGRKPAAGKTWWPMSYSPLTGLVYIPAYDVRDNQKPEESPTRGKLVAWDPVRQLVRWSYDQEFPHNSGVLSTAGNLVFQGEGTGEFEAFAATTGKRLWHVSTGSAIDAVPISFRVKGEQYVVVPVGWGSATRLFRRANTMATPSAKRGPARLLAFKLGATVPFPTPADIIPDVPKPPARSGNAAVLKQGEELYETHLCAGCHSPEADGSGAWVVNGAVPDLRYAPPEVHQQWDAIVLGGSHRLQGMMPFGIDQHFPDIKALTPDESHAIHAYVIEQAWKAYERQTAGSRRENQRPKPTDP